MRQKKRTINNKQIKFDCDITLTYYFPIHIGCCGHRNRCDAGQPLLVIVLTTMWLLILNHRCHEHMLDYCSRRHRRYHSHDVLNDRMCHVFVNFDRRLYCVNHVPIHLPLYFLASVLLRRHRFLRCWSLLRCYYFRCRPFLMLDDLVGIDFEMASFRQPIRLNHVDDSIRLVPQVWSFAWRSPSMFDDYVRPVSLWSMMLNSQSM